MLFYSTSQWLFCLIRQNCFKIPMEEKCAEITKVFEQRGMNNEAELILSDADPQPCHEYHGVAHGRQELNVCHL